MGLLDKLLGREKASALTVADGVATLCDRGVAESLVRPKKPQLDGDESPSCPACGRAQNEVLITTFDGRTGGALWLEVPIAVDGWVCAPCASLRYPRRMTPQRILAIEAEATQHGRAGRFLEAERCFVRIVWDWPGYEIGHANYADATRDRLRRAPGLDDAVRARLNQRIVEQLEQAVAGHAKESDPRVANVVAHAQLTLAEVTLETGAIERARRALDECARLPGLSAPHRERLDQIRQRLPLR
jgi:hypothetical protein